MKSNLLISACAAAITIGFADTGFAQEAESYGADASEIVVTATRREQRLQDVALAVTALGSEELRTKGINNVMDLGAGKVPGLQAASLFGSETAVNLAIRGQTAADASQGTTELPVALYIDGVPYSRAQGAALDLVTPERIEVLRGPQGQLFGRNAQAGAVQIVSKRPTGEWNGDFTATVGSYSTNGLKGRIDLPSFGGINVQVSGFYRDHGGYVDTPANPSLQNIIYFDNHPLSSYQFKQGKYDKNLSQLKTYGGRIALDYTTGALNIFYSYDQSWARDDQGLTFFDTSSQTGTIFNPTSTFDSPATIFSNSGPGGTTLIFRQYPLGSPQVGNKFQDSLDFSIPYVPFITKAHGHILNLSYEASDNIVLRSISGYRYINRYGGNTLSQAVNAVLPSSTEWLRSRTYSQEFQAIYSGTSFDVTMGAIYFREEIKDERESFFSVNCLPAPGFPCTVNGQPSRPGFLGSGFKRSLSTTEAYGLYGQASWRPAILGDNLELIAGIRYSDDTKRGHRPIDFGLCSTGAQAICTGTTPGFVNIRNEFSTKRFDPAFTIKYNFSADINVYARYARGYRDGGSSVRSPVFGAYNEDELTSWEIGLKSQFFDRRVTFNAAAFHNTLKNEQVSLQSNPSLSPSLTDTFNSLVDRKVKGFEAELSIRPLRGLSLSANYTYLTANKINVGLDAIQPGQLPSAFTPTGSFSDLTGFVPDAATLAAHPNSTIVRLSPQSAPKHSGSISADYTVPLGEVSLVLHGDWLYHSRMVTGAPAIYSTSIINGVATPKPLYNSGIRTDRFNARISFQNIPLAGGAAGEISLWMKNVLNSADGAFAFAAGNALSASQPQPFTAIYLQQPRTIGADFRVKF